MVCHNKTLDPGDNCRNCLKSSTNMTDEQVDHFIESMVSAGMATYNEDDQLITLTDKGKIKSLIMLSDDNIRMRVSVSSEKMDAMVNDLAITDTTKFQ